MIHKKKILLTGATGYIGKRLLPILVDKGYHVVCCVRDLNRFSPPESLKAFISVIKLDLLDTETLKNIPTDIDGAFYLVHSMSSSGDYEALELQCATNFKEALQKTNCEHLIYLSGIVNDENLSKHLSSRKNVENELSKGTYHCTTLRAGIIIGSGSASFEIIRDIVEKLPLMVTPKWLDTKCQPIGIVNVVEFLSKSLLNPEVYDDSFDIGGPDILTYKEMLLEFGKKRNLKRTIITLPVMTPKLSSYWLYFVTSTSFKLASALVSSMKVEVICKDNRLSEILNVQPLSYRESLDKAFLKIESNQITSSWKDAFISGEMDIEISDFIKVPTFGCFIDKRSKSYRDKNECLSKIWRIGGKTGWYYGTWLWQLRGHVDKLFGGVGLRRGRTNESSLIAGDSIDFWRVIYVNKEEGRLLLFAEMKLPGEAWLEFKIEKDQLIQTATFRPLGLSGRLYWYAVLPFHGFIFKGMLRKLTS
ncbi:SDR family oxidoreductase [Polaribacter sp. SA4-12]|uniref:SDR family oxidoreductase n=1 Tax=Polaribacter sp. SA4-12 TaxID=1312072 RepID=UPI000B3BF8AA|nr:SDR family oxidoreductase [Polaribacter sp. SA4-12]ARV14107.1 epimerase [Polaribacter sp. SA4-12]